MAPLRRGPWWLLLAGGLAIVLVAAGLAGWWLARTYGPALTRERVESRLAAALGRPVRVERVVIRPWLGRLAFEGVSVAAGETWEAGTLLGLGRAELRVGISSLWRRELVLSRVLLRNVDVHYVASGDGDVALPAMLPNRISLGPITALLRTIRVERAHLTYRDPAAGREVVVEGAAVTAHPSAQALDVLFQVAQVRLEAPEAKETLGNLEGRARLRGDRLTIRALRARWREGSFRLEGEAAGLGVTPDLALRLDGTLPLAPLAAQLGAAWPVEGTASGRATIQGAWPMPNITATVSAPSVVVGRLRARQVRATGSWSGAEIRVTELTAEALGGSVRGSLVFRPDRPADSRIRGRLTAVSVAELASLAGRSLGLEGRVTLEGELSGDLRRLAAVRASVRVESDGLRLAGEVGRLGPASVSATTRFADGMLHIEQAALRWPTARLELRGPVELEGPRGLHATLTADLGQTGRLWQWDHISGRASLVAEAHGRWDAPRITGEVRAPAVVAAGVRLEQVAVPFVARDRGVEIVQMQARLGDTRIAVSGQGVWLGGEFRAAAVAEQLRFALEIQAPAARVEDLSAWLPPAWRGSGGFALSAHVEGVPARWRGSGMLEAAALTLRYPVEDVGARFAVTGDGLEVQRLDVRAFGIPMAGRGTWRWDGTGRLEADVGPARLGALPGPAARLGLSGSAWGRATLARADGRLTGSMHVDAGQVTVMGVALGDGTARLGLHGDTVQGELLFPSGRLSASGAGRLGEGQALDVRLRLEEFDATQAARRFLPEAVAPEGLRLAAKAELTVPLDDPATAHGAIVLDPVRLRIADESWTNSRPFVLRRTPGVFHLDRVELISRVGTVAGSGMVRDDGRLDLSLRGRAPLRPLVALRPEIREAEGVLQATVSVGGTTAAPEVTGEGTISEGLLALRDYPDTLRGVRAELRASPGVIRLVSASGSIGGGSVRAAGELRIERPHVGGFRFTATAQRVAFTPLEGLDTTWDADVELIGTGPRAQLRGEARLVRGTYSRDISLLRLLLERRARAGGPTRDGLHLDLRAELEDNLSVRTPLARLRAGGTLAVQGTTEAPIVFGTVTVREGQVVFRRHTFTLTSASARFTDPRRIDPELDVRGTARIRGYDVTLHMTGRSDDLRIGFTSVPPLPEEDVLALVAFGGTREQLGRAGAGAFAGELAAFLIQDLIGVQPGQAGVDVFEVDTAESGSRSVRIGKQLTPQMLVVYSQGLDVAEERKLRVEYQVFGPLVIAGEQDFRGGFGGDVVIRLRFR